MEKKQSWKFSTFAPGLRLCTGVLFGALIGIFLPLDGKNIVFIVSPGVLLILFLAYKKYFAISYWLAAISIGLWLSVNIPSRNFLSTQKILPDIPTLFQGEIISIVKQDSTISSVIAEGRLDTKYFKPFNSRILLTVFHAPEEKENFFAGRKFSTSLYIKVPQEKILPADFDEASFCRAQDLQFIATAQSENIVLTSSDEGRYTLREKILRQIGSKIEKSFSPSYQGLALALVTGDKTKISPELKEKFSLSGTAHVLAVSGLHVGIISAAIFVLLGFVRNQKVKFFLFVAGLCAFIFITGLQASALRAGIMAFLFAYSRLIQRKAHPLNIVLVTTICLLLIFPQYFVSAGFLMSVGAISGIVLLYERFKNFFTFFLHLPDFLANSFALTFAASAIVSPIVAYYWGIFSFVSPFANLIIIPLTSLAMIFTMLCLAFPAETFFSKAYAGITELLFRICEQLTDAALRLPYASVSGEEIFLWSILISLFLLYIFFSATKRQIFFRLGISALCIIISSNFSTEKKNLGVKIIPRENFVAAIIEIRANEKLVLMMDRKKNLAIRADKPFLEFIGNTKGKIFVCGRGYVSRKNIALLLKIRSLKVIPSNEKIFDDAINVAGMKNLPSITEPVNL